MNMHIKYIINLIIMTFIFSKLAYSDITSNFFIANEGFSISNTTLTTQADSPTTITFPNKSGTLSINYQNFTHVLTVGDGGEYTTVNNALSTISDNNYTNSYLIKLSPGIFEEQVIMKEYVDIEGSGKNVTTIKYFGGSSLTNSYTVKGANHSEIRNLSVISFGTSKDYAIGVFNSDTSLTISKISILSYGATTNNYGIRNFNSPVTMSDIRIDAYGGTKSYGIANISSSLTSVSNISIEVKDAVDNIGLSNENSVLTATNFAINSFNGTNNYGVNNFSSSSINLSNFIIKAYNETNDSHGVKQSSGVLKIYSSQIYGNTKSITVIDLANVSIACTQLTGNL